MYKAGLSRLCFPFDEDLLNTTFSEHIDHSQNKLFNMKPAVILANLIAVTAALRIPSQHSTQSIVVLETEDIEIACSIFCIGLSKFKHFKKYLMLSGSCLQPSAVQAGSVWLSGSPARALMPVGDLGGNSIRVRYLE